MSAGNWTSLITAVVGLLSAVAAWVRAQTAKTSAMQAHERITTVAQSAEVPVPPGPDSASPEA